MPEDTEQEDGSYDKEAMKEFLGQEPAAGELILRIMQQSAKETAWIGDQLANSYKQRAERAEAQLALVRMCIDVLLSRDYMPSAIALERALWPSEEDVNDYLLNGHGSM